MSAPPLDPLRALRIAEDDLLRARRLVDHRASQLRKAQEELPAAVRAHEKAYAAASALGFTAADFGEIDLYDPDEPRGSEPPR